MFYEIVAKARTIDVLMNPGGATDYDGTLQVVITFSVIFLQV